MVRPPVPPMDHLQDLRSEMVKQLEAVGVELAGLVDPVKDGHRPAAGDVVEVALGEGREADGHPLYLTSSRLGEQHGVRTGLRIIISVRVKFLS